MIENFKSFEGQMSNQAIGIECSTTVIGLYVEVMLG